MNLNIKLISGNNLDESFNVDVLGLQPVNLFESHIIDVNVSDRSFMQEFKLKPVKRRIIRSVTEEPHDDLFESKIINPNISDAKFMKEFNIQDIVNQVVPTIPERKKKETKELYEMVDISEDIIIQNIKEKRNILSDLKPRLPKNLSITEHIDIEDIRETAQHKQIDPVNIKPIDFSGDVEEIKGNVSMFIEEKENQFNEQLSKMRQDFISLQNSLNQKINAMTLFTSGGSGGGEVNMLKLDDVDTSNLSANKSYPKYNIGTGKIEFVSAAEIGQAISVTDEDIQTFNVDATIVENQYIDLQSEIASGTEQYTELDYNGLSQDYGLTFSLVNGYSDRLDISELGVVDGDHIRVRWKKA